MARSTSLGDGYSLEHPPSTCKLWDPLSVTLSSVRAEATEAVEAVWLHCSPNREYHQSQLSIRFCFVLFFLFVAGCSKSECRGNSVRQH